MKLLAAIGAAASILAAALLLGRREPSGGVSGAGGAAPVRNPDPAGPPPSSEPTLSEGTHVGDAIPRSLPATRQNEVPRPVPSAARAERRPAIPEEAIAGVLNLPETLDFWIDFLSRHKLSAKPDLDYPVRGAIGFPFQDLKEGDRAWLQPKKVGETGNSYSVYLRKSLGEDAFHGGFFRERLDAQIIFFIAEEKTKEIGFVISLPTDTERNQDAEIDESGPIPRGYILRYFPDTRFKNCWTVVEVDGVPKNANEFPPLGRCGGNLDVDEERLRQLEAMFRFAIKEVR